MIIGKESKCLKGRGTFVGTTRWTIIKKMKEEKARQITGRRETIRSGKKIFEKVQRKREKKSNRKTE